MSRDRPNATAPGTQPGTVPRVDMDWLADVACADAPLEWFFPTGGGDSGWKRGLELCAGCPVVTECGEHFGRWPKLAMMQQTGTFAGTTASQRRNQRLGGDRSMRKRRQAEARAARHQVYEPGSDQS